jgi:integrase
MRILTEFAVSGCHRFSKKRTNEQLPPAIENPLTRALVFAEKELGWAKGTVISRSLWIRRFVRYVMVQRRVRAWKDIKSTDLVAYIGSLRIGRGSRGAALSCIKAMYRVLFLQGILPTPLHEKIPPFARPRDSALSTIWLPSETDAILAAVDRNTAAGKRDYAILVLAMRLGLRSCDIRNLRLDDLRWERSCIEIVQQKTKVSLVLPLLPEIGEALIDYLRNGRPRGDFRQVFLRHSAPHRPLLSGGLWDLLQTYRKKAGLPKRRRGGLSSLRHTLATRMLEDGTGVETIAGVLGHTCIETTRRYLRVDIPLLRQAALDPEEEVAHV